MLNSEAFAVGAGAVKEVTKVIKKRFPNLTVEETIDLASDIVIAIASTLVAK